MRSGRTEKKLVRVSNIPAIVVGFVILVLFVIYASGYAWNALGRQSAEYMRVSAGYIDNYTMHRGIIIRNERVFRADADGVPVWIVNHGQRVRVGDMVASIQDAESVMQFTQQLNALNDAIIDTQDFRAELSVFESDVRNMNAAMTMLANEYSFGINSAEPQAMYALGARLGNMLDDRNNLLFSENRGALAANLEIRTLYEQQLNNAKHNMNTDVSGIVSFALDGMEETLTVGGIGSLSIERTRQTVPPPVALNYANSGAPVFKIIASNTWYIAAFINVSQTADWTAGSNRTIYIEKDGGLFPLQARVHIINNAGLYDYVVFSVNSNLLKFLNVRSVSFRVENAALQGLSIPQTAVAEHMLLAVPRGLVSHDEMGRRFVTTVEQGGRGVRTPIDVLSSSDDFFYVLRGSGDLQLGDAVLDYSGQTHEISEVRIRRGVYTINAGITQFREINLDYSSSNGEHIILNRALNSSIRIGDNVMIDASNVTDGQIFF